MQSDIHKSKIIVYIFIGSILFSNCNRKTGIENQITIKIISIDRETKQRRVNQFDTIEVSKEAIGYLMKAFEPVGEYVTDSTGSVNIKIDNNQGYKFLLRRMGYYGSANFSEAFTKEKLKNGQEVNIEVFSIIER